MTTSSPPAGPGTEPLIDTHVHFWDPRRLSYAWLGEVPALDRPFTADDFDEVTAEPVEAVFIESGRADHQAGSEVEWVREEARSRPWIRGAVAHVPLDDPARARAAISGYGADPFVVGVRHNIQDEPSGFTRTAGFRAGVRLLGRAGLTFDACVREHQLPELAELARACPQTVIVLDHLGKPSLATSAASWRRSLRALADCDNVVCKLSGLTTEVAAGTSRAAMLSALREALEAFGPERCMYGGDWPVMTSAAPYESWLALVRTALAGSSGADTEAVLRSTALRIYRLDRSGPQPAGRPTRRPTGERR
jgi:L-fuconolactonase